MNHHNNYYITTHRPLPWKLPFSHRLIGVEGFEPAENEGIPAGKVISRLLDSETAFGAMRAYMAVNSELDKINEKSQVFIGTYRLFLGKESQENWLSPILQENRIVSPNDISENWQNIVATEMPAGVDIMIPSPRLLPDTVMGQYARVHILEDLMFAVGCAIRSGLLEPLSVPTLLSTNTLIPYGNFAASKKIRYEFNQRLWACALDFYKNYYIPRSGYQRRVIDFVFERISSMAIIQMVAKNNLNCISCRNILVSTTGKYRQSD